MDELTMLRAVLDSLDTPILFADAGHTIRYMNRAAVAHYPGGKDLLGRSLLECHNPCSQRIILEVLNDLQAGMEERLISENEHRRVYMRAVRDPEGRLLGYYERYEPRK
ncbi:MAG: PAS domain-containing protein [Thermoflexia bacterium]|nr:MAG: PAS domain-containing protein [Thermoflexia bacterium]